MQRPPTPGAAGGGLNAATVPAPDSLASTRGLALPPLLGFPGSERGRAEQDLRVTVMGKGQVQAGPGEVTSRASEPSQDTTLGSSKPYGEARKEQQG